MNFPEPIAKLIDSYSKLPGIGKKTATRLAFFSLKMDQEDIEQFSESLYSIKKDLTVCDICGNITDIEHNPCVICTDPARDQNTVFVVENATDLIAIENTKDYKGLYHVLNGVINPMSGTTPEDINILSLIQRLRDNKNINEVILGTNATTEGEATALYISKLIKPSGIKVSRLAYGLSVGSDIDYADEMTLGRAVEGRVDF